EAGRHHAGELAAEAEGAEREGRGGRGRRADRLVADQSELVEGGGRRRVVVAAGRVDDGVASLPGDAAGDADRIAGGGGPAVRAGVAGVPPAPLRRTDPRDAVADATLDHLLPFAGAAGLPERAAGITDHAAGVLGRRHRAGDQLLGLRGGELP